MKSGLDSRLGLLVKESLGAQLPQGACLTDEEVTLLVEGEISQDERMRMLSHGATCETCMELVRTCLALQIDPDEVPLNTPARLAARAQDLMPGVGKRIIDVVVQMGKEGLEAFSSKGVILPQAAPALGPVRGAHPAGLSSVQASAAKEDLPVKIMVESQGEDLFSLMVDIEHINSSRLRLSLHRDGRILRSSLATSERVAFDRLRAGSYIVVIHDGKDELASLALRADRQEQTA